MTDHPANAVEVDNVSPAKADFRSYMQTRVRLRVASAAEVNGKNYSDALGLDVAAILYDRDTTDTTTADDGGISCIVDNVGTRFKVKGGAITTDSDPTLSANTDTRVATQRATKSYVDAVAQGLSAKPSAILATTTTLPTYTYANGASGIGATLTMTATGVVAIDGTNLALGNVLLVKNETAGNAPYNGLYVVTVAGAVGVALVLTRHTSMDATGEYAGAYVFVETGTVNAAAGFVCTNSAAATPGTTAISFTQFSGAGEITAGNGLGKSGNTLSIDTSITVDKTTAQTLTNKTFDSTSVGATASARDGTTKLATNAYVDAATRVKLTGARTYYVRTDGSDSNNGLANTSGGAFLTIQKAVDTIANTIDLGGFQVTIQVGTGTFAGTVTVSGPWDGQGIVLLQGDTTTPSNVVISGAIAVGVIPTTSVGANGASLFLGGFKLTAAGNQISVNEQSLLNIVGKMEYAGSGTHLLAQRFSSIYVNADYTISSNCSSHWKVSTNGSIVAAGRTITLSGSPVFSAGFANCARQSRIICGTNTFSGSSGSSSLRYAITTMGLIDTSGGGATYLPGDTSGTNDGSGLYN
jgi:hypothetical protein